jgi:hypothetical protein
MDYPTVKSFELAKADCHLPRRSWSGWETRCSTPCKGELIGKILETRNSRQRVFKDVVKRPEDADNWEDVTSEHIGETLLIIGAWRLAPPKSDAPTCNKRRRSHR